MTLPTSYATVEIESLAAALGEDPLAHLENLCPDDLVLIGAFIQASNFIEFNLRRSVSLFVHAGLVPQKKRIVPSDLVKMAVTAVSRMDPAVEDIPGTVGRLDELEFRRPFRNLFAHWAAKRIRGHDALYLMSCDGRDAEQVMIGEIDRSHGGFAIILLPDVRGLVKHIAQYESWLAQKTADWYVRYSR
ncbi:hypothetical protein B0G75_109206 [Paraburkholderia sp. BL18I3N2]|uniref:hypothetical protein n=1 Tax=Paraburkholderia sp. BL18I3N2 TaxID=1938799 RepID=UPI000D0712E9|nr:hypothetical protein [Paraburkholderia sp. BL18I3N2]PRX29218.1 hypothetical protein B0G75_109206 [Paraburkholderia sp. BL18I3N2]